MDPKKHFISPVSEISNVKLATLLLILLTAYICFACYQAFVGALAKVPGPAIARFSSVWRVRNAASGKAPTNYQNLHKKYGSIVRTGPSHVSVSDPTLIPVIYGISSKFTKVSEN
jgi:hypothetical protein